MDWLIRLFEVMPVRGQLDLRCNYGTRGASIRPCGQRNPVPRRARAGSAILEDPAGGRPMPLKAGDILLLPGNPRHVMHDQRAFKSHMGVTRAQLRKM
jgi:AraC family transcriptional regulator, activator of mtrCDE